MFDNEKLSKLSPMQRGRVEEALNKLYRFDGMIGSLRELLQRRAQGGGFEKCISDGMLDWKRRTFNSLDHKGQREYEARLKEKRYYWVAGSQVPKIVFDIVDAPISSESLPS